MVTIRRSRRTEVEALLAIWRRAVDASHFFLLPADRIAIDAEVKQLLPEMPMWVAADDSDRPLGFMILSDAHLEALFVDPDVHGRGVGRRLVEHALAQSRPLTTDVNEQNPKAIGFYERLGFVRTGRSSQDGQGRPYPLLHMRLD